MSVTLADFPAFFAAVNSGRTPFSWQTRLVGHLVGTGRWPERLVAPTGAGKTSAIDAHVFAVAAAGNGPNRPPRRLAMVVDRRVLVDDQYERARALEGQLADAAAGKDIVAQVSRALRALAGEWRGVDAPPLVVARLRGGEPPSVAWREDPSACAIICATPDMWGSRLLLRGYGSSQHSRPIEAGLLALDCAAVIDEAHLTQQALATARRIASLQDAAPLRIGVGLLQPVETTATPAPGEASEVGVLESDLVTDEILSRRLLAPKELRLIPRERWPIPAKGPDRRTEVAALGDEVARLRDELGPTVGCFVNTVATAIDVAEDLRRRDLVVELVCGRLRRIDVQRLRRRRPGLLSALGDPSVDVLVATQSLEVGVDIDLAGAVTELAPGSSLAQRAGRVNRTGARPRGVVAVVVPHDPPVDNSGPYTAESLALALAWLQGRAAEPAGLAPWALRADPPPLPPGRLLHRLELAEAWHLARTSVPLAAEPDLDVWLSDDLEQQLDAGVIVRRGLTGDALVDIPYLRAAEGLADEAFPVSLGRTRRLYERAAAEGRPVYVIDAGEILDPSAPLRLRPAALVVVDDETPILRGGVVDDDPTEVADDVRELAAALRDRADLRLGLSLPVGLVADQVLLEAVMDDLADVDVDSRPGRDALAARIAYLAESIADDFWAPHLTAVANALRHARLVQIDVDVVPDDEGRVRLVVITDRRRRLTDDVRQASTSGRAPVPLDDHQAAVGARARAIGASLGLGTDHVALLGLAGDHHDDGKADHRFQLALEADGTVLAKSAMTSRAQVLAARARSGLPAGWRHEQLSAALAWEMLASLPEDDRDLAIRLIGTSHGHGRPDFPHAARGLAVGTSDVSATAEELFGAGRWDVVMEEGDRRFGVWGAAYLEALLRAADVQISREGG